MDTKKPPRCATCMFWGTPGYMDEYQNTCHRHPPIPVMFTDGLKAKWPTTTELDYCGEHIAVASPIDILGVKTTKQWRYRLYGYCDPKRPTMLEWSQWSAWVKGEPHPWHLRHVELGDVQIEQRGHP